MGRTTTPCPGDDVLGAHVQRSLGETETETVAAHLDECAACREVVVAAVRARPRARDDHGAPRREEVKPRRIADRYELRELLGAGGMALVFAAHDAELDRTVALKLVRPELAGDPAVLAERLVRESRAMARLAHPSVITVFDAGRSGDEVFIAMELIRGATLGAYVREREPSQREVVELLVRAGEGLAAAHDAGLVHRDFKPENVLVEYTGDKVRRVVVTDFGVARTMTDPAEAEEAVRRASNPHLTAPGTVVGTPAYMAPEQLDGGTVDARADVFAFSASAWELLFGERPFTGKSVQEIKKAMRAPLRVPRTRVAAVLARGLAYAPAERYADMHALVRDLAATRRTLVPLAIAVGGGVAIAAVAGAYLIAGATSKADPCARGLATFDTVYGAGAEGLERLAAAWRATHLSTCSADGEPPQAPNTLACLEARRVELAGVAEDLRGDGAAHAARLIALVGEPASCARPSPAALVARVPDDAALRRKVTALRYRLWGAEAAAERGEFRPAIPALKQLVAEAAPLWPPLHAEALYALGNAQIEGGRNAEGIPTLRDAAAVAERVRADVVAARAWASLVITSAFDLGDHARALEYVEYGAAAVERLGSPPDAMVRLAAARGAVLSETKRGREAEDMLRKALVVAEAGVPKEVGSILSSLAMVVERSGRTREAAALYRRALAASTTPLRERVIRQQLSACLGVLGEVAEAERESRRAAEVADRLLDEGNLDRALAHANLAEILLAAGKHDEALAQVRWAAGRVAAIVGERTARYADVIQIEAQILSSLDRDAEADKVLARACEITAYATGEQSLPTAECTLNRVIALSGVGQNELALELTQKLLPVLEDVLGPKHAQVANAYAIRGGMRGALGDHRGAVADLEHAIALFTAHGDALDPGYGAGSLFMLAKELWKTDRVRARAFGERAVAQYAKAAPQWKATHEEAIAWLAAHR